MIKVGVLFIESLPMPPVNGGAVENLFQSIIEFNESSNDFEFHVYSKYNRLAADLSGKYAHTKFHYYRPLGIDLFFEFIIKCIRFFFRHILNIYLPSLYEILAKKTFKKENLHTIILENSPYSSIYLNNKNEFYVIQHLHNDYINTHTRLIDKLLLRSNQIIAVSHFIEKSVNRVINQKIPIDVCYNGIDLSKFSCVNQYEVEKLRFKYKISQDDCIITYIGRLVESKGVKELMLAFEKALQYNRHLKLLIIGSNTFSNNTLTPYIQELRDISRRFESNIIFTGYVNYKDIPLYLKLSNIGVVPSIGNESFSLSTLETLATGIPVIISDAGGILEVIDNMSGYVVKRGNNFVDELACAIKKITIDKNNSAAMSEAAKRRANYFSAEKMYNNFKKLI
jgi:glycosyltransferase involved in cell wall biosynthesis